jgi:phosphatidylserine/phosphatidylglycerophosphate/cardiolipin synthase-like enzyme
MDKRIIIIPLLLMSIIALKYLPIDVNLLHQFHEEQPTTRLTTVVEDNGTLTVFFCPHDDCEQQMRERMNAAQQSIHCAFYDFNLPSLERVLDEKSNQIDVKVVMDQRNARPLTTKKFPLKTDRSSGFMHNKFCVIDGEQVFTGSTNPTVNGVTKNTNNLVVISSRVIAQNYDDEFNELWTGTFRGGEVVKNPLVDLNGILVENYFCPEDNCEEKVVHVLKAAKKSVYFMTFSFTSDRIANTLLIHHHTDNDVVIQGIVDAQQVNDHSAFTVLTYQGIDVVKDKEPAAMHHKVFIIDEEIVVTGSYNPTMSGNRRNDENILIIHDQQIAQRYLQEFQRLRHSI